ncbi:hypothetical protein E4U09_002863 [Claviceps aff. purpurea]|uniref:Uncharacterized protein n=1 Tax=Claviceps aff. purpurea TaxID=1967640 RepID=A0A9P7U1E0_9HYPO|nr:hypothetical protein E4U09_002863 [Claviceps aff. purpurea]
MNRPSTFFAEAMGDSSYDRPYQVKMSDEAITRLHRFPQTTKVSIWNKLVAIEKALCEPAPDEDDFVFGKYEMAVMQAMEPHILEQTWSSCQSDEGKVGACEKLVLELAQLTYERRIAKILDPSFGRESGVTLDRALEMMVRGRQPLREDVPDPVQQTGGGGGDGDGDGNGDGYEYGYGDERERDGEREREREREMERCECEDYDMESEVYDLRGLPM